MVKERDEGGYKADYEERGVDRGCFCWSRKRMRVAIKRTMMRRVWIEGVSAGQGKG